MRSVVLRGYTEDCGGWLWLLDYLRRCHVSNNYCFLADLGLGRSVSVLRNTQTLRPRPGGSKYPGTWMRQLRLIRNSERWPGATARVPGSRNMSVKNIPWPQRNILT